MTEKPLAREHHEDWAPITNGYCAGERARYRLSAHTGSPGAIWEPDGQSYSCSYCGSMSTEEFLESLDATPRPGLAMSDSGHKVYVQRYLHAGGCLHEVDTLRGCDPKRGGGPIKFYARHLFDDPSRPDAEANGIWARVRAMAADDLRELMAELRGKPPAVAR